MLLASVLAAALIQAPNPSVQHVQYDHISMRIPAGWRLSVVNSTEASYGLYTPLAQGNQWAPVTGISMSEDSLSSDYATLSGAIRALRKASPNVRIVSTKDQTTLGTLKGFDIEFTEGCSATSCPPTATHHYWKFGTDNTAFYCVGINGSETMYRQLLGVYRRLLPTVVIRGRL